jgi:tetratricopeptide (TPR) repeat protein
VLPGVERDDLEKQCTAWLKGLPPRIVAQDRTAEVTSILTRAGQASCKAPAHSAGVSDKESCGVGHPLSGHTVDADVHAKHETEGLAQVHATVAKEKGNTAFRHGDFRKAITHYTMALRVVETSHEDGVCSDATTSLRAALFSNRSAAHASSAMWQQALNDAREAVKLDDQCAKYWCRKGAAQLGCGQLQDATFSYKQALELDGNSTAARAGLEIARSRIADTR